MNIKVINKTSGEEKLYEIPQTYLSDFQQWNGLDEINKPLNELFEEVSVITVTEEAQEEPFISPVKLRLPRNTLNNLYRDYDKVKLNTTEFTKQRKELLLKVVSEIIAEFKPNENYEVKISS